MAVLDTKPHVLTKDLGGDERFFDGSAEHADGSDIDLDAIRSHAGRLCEAGR